MMVELGLGTLKKLDLGKAEAAFAAELKRVIADLYDRPGDTSARSVTLKMSVTPVIEAGGGLDTARVSFEITSKIPPRKTKDYDMEAKRPGILAFSEHSPDAVRQGTLADLADANERNAD